MYFKLEVNLNRLQITIREEQPVTFAIDDKGTTVQISQLNADERQSNPLVLKCRAMIQHEPSPELQDMFSRLANNQMPKSFKLSKEQQKQFRHIDASGKILEGHGVWLKLFPDTFQELSSRVRHDLSESINQSVKVLRWRMGMTSSHKPIHSSRGVSFSFDNECWRSLPDDTHAEIEGGPCPRISGRYHNEIQGLISSNQAEPLGHELFLEAWGLRNTAPRSALIIGMSAAEVGFKQCVGKLVPYAEWLANYAPTPPLNRMLSEYLPELPAKLNIEGRVLKPSHRIRKAISEGFEARNGSAHRGAQPPHWRDLKELLLCIRDLLYLLDYYCGFQWALDQIRDEIRQEMVTEFGLQATTPYSIIDLG
jgi:hypothetical protein